MKLITVEENGIYRIASEGVISLERGLKELEEIKQFYRSRNSAELPLKVLIDMRKAVWESRIVHDELARRGRGLLNPTSSVETRFIAILNNKYSAQTFENEQWFVDEEKATQWLLNK